MPLVPIADLDDPRLAIYRHLKATNQTRRSGQFVLEGEKLLDALLASRFPIASTLATDRRHQAIAAKLPADVPLYVIPHERIAALVGYDFHLGVLSCGIERPWPPLAELIPQPPTSATVVVCPRLDNPDNLGALIRLADVFAITAMVVGGRCPDPFSRRVLRVSMGGSLRVPVVAEPFEAAWQRLADAGFTFLAAVPSPEATPFDAYRRPPRLALVLGSESAGLDPRWRLQCDGQVTIPMRPGADSLNVAVAAGILLYHLTKDSNQPRVSVTGGTDGLVR